MDMEKIIKSLESSSEPNQQIELVLALEQYLTDERVQAAVLGLLRSDQTNESVIMQIFSSLRTAVFEQGGIANALGLEIIAFINKSDDEVLQQHAVLALYGFGSEDFVMEALELILLDEKIDLDVRYNALDVLEFNLDKESVCKRLLKLISNENLDDVFRRSIKRALNMA